MISKGFISSEALNEQRSADFVLVVPPFVQVTVEYTTGRGIRIIRTTTIRRDELYSARS